MDGCLSQCVIEVMGLLRRLRQGRSAIRDTWTLSLAALLDESWEKVFLDLIMGDVQAFQDVFTCSDHLRRP